MSKYKLKSNLSEKQLEADVASYFGWISRGTPFRLLDIDETITGADKKFYDSGFPIFMQFKVSNGLVPASIVPVSTRKNRSTLEDIREFREIKELGDDPTLYFELRKRAKNAGDYQHNVLMTYANTGYSQAFYVAPLNLDKSVYYKSLFDTVNRYLPRPFHYTKVKLHHRDWVSHLGYIPFLKEHISIIPHEYITTHKHYYSYSTTGCDLAWHSPEVLSNEPTRLSDILSKTIRKCIQEGMFSDYEKVEFMLDDALSKLEIDEEDNPVVNYPEDSHPIERIQNKARYISKRYGIRLILLLVNRKLADEMSKSLN